MPPLDSPRLASPNRALAALLLVLLGSTAVAQEAPLSGKPEEDRLEELWRTNGGQSGEWESERLSAGASAVLASLAHSLSDGVLDAELLIGSFAEGFRCNDLRPTCEVVREEGGVLVRRAERAQLVESELRESGAVERLAAFPEPLRGGTHPTLKFKVVRVEVASPGEFTTEALVHAGAELGGGAVQLNARWRVSWSTDDEGEQLPRIFSIEALEFDEVRITRRPFVDRTSGVLGRAGGSTEILAAGSEVWRAGIDNLGEPNYFGHNGLAVGDVDGDELDDLYVAQGTGLPNLLFVQQQDGSFLEVGEASGAAWLDDTKGVLLADFDNDGDRDLLCAIGPILVLSTNDGTGHFTPAHSLSSPSRSFFYSLAAADYDLDGDLDLYAVRYVETRYGESLPMPFHDARNGPRNKLMRNDGDEGFVDVTESVGLERGQRPFQPGGNLGGSTMATETRTSTSPTTSAATTSTETTTGCSSTSPRRPAPRIRRPAWGSRGRTWTSTAIFDLLVSNMFSSAGQRMAYQPRFKGVPAKEVGERFEVVQRHSLGNSLFCGTSATATFDDVSDAAGVRMGRWSWGARFSRPRRRRPAGRSSWFPTDS